MILKNVKSMTNMGRMHSRKEWVVVVACMTHLISSHPSLVVADLEVRHLNRISYFHCILSPHYCVVSVVCLSFYDMQKVSEVVC